MASFVDYLRAEATAASYKVQYGERSALSQHHCNEKLRNDVISGEDSVLKQTNFSHYQTPWADMQAHAQRANQALKAFEQNTDYTNLLEFDQQKCLKDCEQQVPREQLVHKDDTPNSDGFVQAQQRFNALRITCDGKPFFGDALGRAMKQISQAEQNINLSTLDSSHFTQPLFEVHSLMEQLLKLPTETEDKDLQDIDETIRRLAFDAEAVKREQQQLLTDGDIKEGEEKYYETLQLQELTATTVRQKFDVLDSYTMAVIEKAISKIHAVQQRCNSMCDALLQEGTSLKHSCAADIRSISNFIGRVNTEHDNYIQRYQTEMERSDDCLKDIQKKQEAIWNKMAALEREFMKLCKDRCEEIHTRITNFESAEKHKVRYSNFIDFTKKHKETLQATVKNCDMHQYLAQFMRNFVTDHCDTMILSLNARKNGVEEQRLQAHEQHLEHFRDLYLTVGELTHKKTCTRDELDQQIQTTDAQLEICMDSWNPDAKVYSQKKKELVRLRVDLDSQLNTLQQTQQQYLEWFQPTEEYFKIMDKPYSHPKDELTAKMEERKGKIADYRALMAAPPAEEDYPLQEELKLLHAPTLSQFGVVAPADERGMGSPTSLVIGGMPLRPAPPNTNSTDKAFFPGRRARNSTPPMSSQLFTYTGNGIGSANSSPRLPSL